MWLNLISQSQCINSKFICKLCKKGSSSNLFVTTQASPPPPPPFHRSALQHSGRQHLCTVLTSYPKSSLQNKSMPYNNSVSVHSLEPLLWRNCDYNGIVLIWRPEFWQDVTFLLMSKCCSADVKECYCFGWLIIACIGQTCLHNANLNYEFPFGEEGKKGDRIQKKKPHSEVQKWLLVVHTINSLH